MCCSARRANRRNCIHPPHVSARRNELSEALLVGEGVRRAAGARPASSPQVLLPRSSSLSGLLETTDLICESWEELCSQEADG